MRDCLCPTRRFSGRSLFAAKMSFSAKLDDLILCPLFFPERLKAAVMDDSASRIVLLTFDCNCMFASLSYMFRLLMPAAVRLKPRSRELDTADEQDW